MLICKKVLELLYLLHGFLALEAVTDPENVFGIFRNQLFETDEVVMDKMLNFHFFCMENHCHFC